MKQQFLYYFLILTFFSSCVSYYQKNAKFNEQFQRGQLAEAKTTLLSDKKAEQRKTKLLYFLNRGVVASMQGNFEESNTFFEKAYIFTEDYRKKTLQQVAALITNPKMITYGGEDHELLLINYYKALNYLQLDQFQSALVECKRMNIRLNQLSDKYKGDKKFQEDAFVHILMGVIYEANQDFNNAFIAYRNAIRIYEDVYSSFFNLPIPNQLKQDVMRTAYIMGFSEDLRRFEKKFGMTYQHNEKDGNLVFLWHNGLAPIKTEWSINFVMSHRNGQVFFANEELNLNFHFSMSDSDYKKNGLGQLRILRVAYPKYLQRGLVYQNATLSYPGGSSQLSKAEDINAIAFKILKDRMLKEMAQMLLRLAIKKGTEYVARQQNQNLGAVVSIANAVTEQADTRNWQTIPHTIYYTRVSLPAGQQQVTLNTQGQRSSSRAFKFEIQKGKTIVFPYSSLEHLPAR